MSGQVISLLDRPTYTYPQVDRLLGLSVGTALRWLNGYRRGGRTYEPILRSAPQDTRWATWGEFVETRLLANYRDDVAVPIVKMRRLSRRCATRSGLTTRSLAATCSSSPAVARCCFAPRRLPISLSSSH